MTIEPLRSSEVHVWSAPLELAPDRVEALRRELAPDEEARAGRMHTRDLARRFIVARAVLRRLLAAYVGSEPGSLSFAYGARGKPSLASSVASANISFNLAHAGDAVVYAIATGRDVGIDIEATIRRDRKSLRDGGQSLRDGGQSLRDGGQSLRDDGQSLRDDGQSLRDDEIERIANKVFSTQECAALKALPPAGRRPAFFRIWSRKEAYIKARGEGFGYPTRSFSVSHCADEDALIADDNAPDAAQRWRVVGLPAPAGFELALAAEGRDWSVRRFDAAAPEAFPEDPGA